VEGKKMTLEKPPKARAGGDLRSKAKAPRLPFRTLSHEEDADKTSEESRTEERLQKNTPWGCPPASSENPHWTSYLPFGVLLAHLQSYFKSQLGAPFPRRTTEAMGLHSPAHPELRGCRLHGLRTKVPISAS